MDKVRIQFEKLKNQGKIRIAEKVKKLSKVDTFEAGFSVKGPKTIKYNGGMNKLQDDEINFWLLHEEGHFKNPFKKTQYVYLGILFILLIPLMLALGAYLHSGTIESILLLLISCILFLLILHPLACVWMKKIQQNREYEADDFACKKIDNPLRIESAFKQARYHSTNKKSCLKKIFAYIICAKCSHPSVEDRISRIKNNYSEIVLSESENERMDEKLVQ